MQKNVPVGMDFMNVIKDYEKKELAKSVLRRSRLMKNYAYCKVAMPTCAKLAGTKELSIPGANYQGGAVRTGPADIPRWQMIFLRTGNFVRMSSSR